MHSREVSRGFANRRLGPFCGFSRFSSRLNRSLVAVMPLLQRGDSLLQLNGLQRLPPGLEDARQRGSLAGE